MNEKPTHQQLMQKIETLKRRLEVLSAATSEAIFFSDGGICIDQNAAAERMFGYTRAEAVGRHATEWIVPADREKVGRNVPADNEKPCQVTALRKDGTTFPAEIQARIFRDEGREVRVTTLRDISERRRTEEALRDLNETMDLAQKMAGIGYWSHDKQSGKRTWSDQMFAVFGCDPKLGPPRNEELEQRWHPEDWRHYLQAFDDALEGKPYDFIARVQFPDGTLHYIHTQGHPRYDVHRRIVGVFGTSQDVTERKRAEEALIASERKWRNILIDTPQIGISLDPEGKITFANAYFQRLTGWDAQEIIGRDWFELFIPESIRGEVQGVFNKVIREKGVLDYSTYENEIVTRSGELRSVSWSNALTQDAQGNVVDVTCLGVDLTERKRAEAALRESEEKYRNIFENAVEGFFQSTPEGRFIDVNPAFARMLGYSDTRQLVDSINDIATQYYVDPQDRRRYQQMLEDTGHVENFEFRARQKNGSQIWVSNSTRAYFDAAGAVVRYEGVVTDISERKRAEQEREKLQAQLIQACKMESIGTLSGGIAHEFNNILGIVLGNAELAMEDIPDWSPVKGFLREIHKASLRGRQIVRQLLSFSRKSESRKRPVDLASVVKEAIGLLRAAIPSNVAFAQDMADGGCTILGDPTMLHQVVINLCTNAAHAMEPTGGRLQIGVRAVASETRESFFGQVLEPGAYVRLSVSDTGHGIPVEIMERVFDPYYSTKEVHKGAGMGLAVVLGIIKNHDGGIRIQSEPGQGTRVECYFPAVAASAGEERTAEAALPGGSESILFVDDEASLAGMAKLLLERLGYRVLTSTDPVEALRIFRHRPGGFDLVITDMSMPQITGEQLVRAMIEIRPDLRTILCTGYSERMDARKAGQLGISAFIMKPFEKVQMAETIRNVLDRTG